MLTRSPYGDLPDQFGDLREPSGHADRPLVVLIHGGFWRDRWRLDLMDPMAEDLLERGYASWNIEYRRVGPSGGGWATTTADVAAAIDHLREGPWPALAVIGHSAGGHLALWNAGRTDAARPADLTIGLAPVADVIVANRAGTGVDATVNFFGGDIDDVPDRYAHGQPNLTGASGRVVLVHGDADDNVPVEQSTSQIDVVDRVEVLPGEDHFCVIDPAHTSWQITLDELARLQSGSQ